MIKLERTSVMNIENAIRGARNPMNSWDKSDSFYGCYEGSDHSSQPTKCDKCLYNLECSYCGNDYILGENDLSLASRLIKAGSDHRKFMRQIFVSVDITAPLYWWKEFDTYKVGTTANSCSTMHKIHAKAFDRDDFSHDRMDDGALAILDAIIVYLESERQKFLADKTNRQSWHNMIQTLPTSYNQMRTVTLTYENLLNQYHARKNHKLDEWHSYCDWIETLPYFIDLCLGGESNGK